MLAIGQGSQPQTTAAPIEGMTVKLFLVSLIPQDYYPVDFKTYHLIWENVPFAMSAITDADGLAKFEGVEPDNYLILGHYLEGQGSNYLARNVQADDNRWILDKLITEPLVALESADGDMLVCQIFRFTGSELLIYQPEFIEWDGRVEYYPIVFESEGAWQVKTIVTPSAGFSADRKSIMVKVVDELEAIQFKIRKKGGRLSVYTIMREDRSRKWQK